MAVRCQLCEVPSLRPLSCTGCGRVVCLQCVAAMASVAEESPMPPEDILCLRCYQRAMGRGSPSPLPGRDNIDEAIVMNALSDDNSRIRLNSGKANKSYLSSLKSEVAVDVSPEVNVVAILRLIIAHLQNISSFPSRFRRSRSCIFRMCSPL